MTGLTAAQERLWFLHRLDPDDASYHLPAAMRLRGHLDAGALERAVATLVERHETLRSRIVERDGVPAWLPAAVPVPLTRVDHTGAGVARAWLAAFTAARFDLGTGPLIRFALIRLDDAGDHVFALVVHHIAADGWSIQVLRRELGEIYAAYAAGKPSPLPPPVRRFADHVDHQAATAADAAADIEFWTDALASPPLLDLPADRPRPPVRSGRGGSIVFDIRHDLLAGLDAVARGQRCTLFMALLAAYQIVLGRHAGQSDVMVGTPVLGRDDPDMASVVGYFSETLVLRGDLSANPTYRDLIRATRGTVLRAFAHRAAPFETILGAVAPERDRARTPLFQAMFMLLRQPDDRPRLGELDVTEFPHPTGHAKTDIALDVIWGPSSASGILTYDAELFDRDTMRRFVAHLLVLVADAVRRPEARIGDLAILDRDERDELSRRWNATAIAGEPGLAPDLFAARARRTPEAIALCHDGTDVTYGQLDRDVDRVATLLRERGRARLVGVCLRRGPAMVAALLGCWRAGAAYLPLDPEYPAGRIEMIVADSGAEAVLTEPDFADRFGDRALLIGTDVGTSAGPVTPVTGADAAYVLYTSGSTGRPKGVVVPHRALAAFLHAMAALCGEQAGRSWLALTSLSFDISGLELFLPLTRGGRVVLVPDGVSRDGPALCRLIAAAGVTDVQATPSGWRLLLDAGFADRSIHALVGGEALPPALAADLRCRVGRLINVYGPTETTIWSSAWEVPPDPDRVSIGGPIAGTRLYVLDDRLDLVPIGVAGELCIAGDGVAHGYLGRPALTADRFAPDPYGRPGSRLYRTGDRVRRLSDGTIEFLGRIDHQVKLRGHRIEPGEIEAVVAACPAVAAAAVVVRDEELVAFVTPAGPAADLVATVLAAARAVLPGYMVPATVVVLDALPLTPNGKVDRRALPSVTRPAPRTRVPLRTEAQRRVAGVFAEVLGVDGIGAEDDFFALGGHSLLAAKVIARLGGVPIRELFDYPTVAGFASRLPDGAGRPPIGPRPSGVPAPLSAAQERLWFLQRLDPGDASYGMFTVLRLRGPLDVAALEHAVTDLAERHETLRTRYPEADGAPVAVVEPSAVRIRHADVSGDADSDGDGDGDVAAARRIVAAQTNAPFDLAEAPPLRVTLIRLAADDHVLCLVLHHIAGDGWSLNILREDLARLYAARRDRVPHGLPALPVTYGDIAYHQRAHPPSASALGYWRDRLAEPAALDLPTDRPRRSASTHRGGFHGFRLSGDVTATLERLASGRRTTLFVVLTALHQVFLAKHTGQADVLVGTVLAGRDRVETEPVVGYLANTVVLRGDLSGAPAFTDVVDAGREAVLAAMAHEDVPFEEVIAAAGPDRDPSRTPLFQTMCILHSQDIMRAPRGRDEPTAAGTFADLAMEFFDSGYAQAKFDLMLEAWRDRDGLSLVFGYDADLFDHDTITRWADRFLVLCAGAAADPDRQIAALPVLCAEDRDRLAALSEATPSRDGALMPDLFAATVAATPDAVAVRCGGDEISYRELDRSVSALASRLVSAGVTSDRVVAVCLDRSVAAVVALLAIWRAGGAYLPLDPELPAERIAFMLADAAAATVVTRPAIGVAWPPGVETVDVETVDMAGLSAPGRFTPVAGADSAYVIYTSGSTGVPKGVVIEHAALAARIAWMRAAYALTPADRVVQFASLSFDAHVEEIFPALAAGATVVLLPAGALSLPDVLAAEPDITVLDLPTAYWHQLVEQIDDVAWPAALRLVILGGEQVHAPAVARWHRRFGERNVGAPPAAAVVRLVNTYGPTEATVIATATDLDGGDGRPPIGRPVGGVRALVVDSGLAPVPPGVVGELLLGGAGLARGYLGRPELTAQRFPARDGARWYRTGDRVRWRADNTLEFNGRVDEQVKVRGFRVEPGEIEARLAAVAGVSGAAVTVRDGALVAYVTGGADHEDLRRHLSAALPAHMVPDVWVALDEIPMTRSGKIDRSRLPAPDAAARPYTPPRTDAEDLVADVWAEVLGVERVSAFDDFFALGGHSLLAVRVGARLRATLDIDVPIRTLFTHRTAADLAVAIETLLTDELAALTDDEVSGLLGMETR